MTRAVNRAASIAAALGAAIVATSIGICAAVVLVLATPQGLKWVLRAANHLLPVELHVERVRGSALDGLRIEGLRFESAGVRVELERFEIEAFWPALSRGRLVPARSGATPFPALRAFSP